MPTWLDYWERVAEKIFRYLYRARGMKDEMAPVQASLITSAVMAQMPVLRKIPAPLGVSGNDFVEGFRLQEEQSIYHEATPEEITVFVADLTFQRAGLAVADYYTDLLGSHEEVSQNGA